MSAGKVIREARKVAGLSQHELAGRAGVPRQSIVRWERGNVEPGFDTVRKLLRSCGYDLSVVPHEPDASVDVRLDDKRVLTPHERVLALLDQPDPEP